MAGGSIGFYLTFEEKRQSGVREIWSSCSRPSLARRMLESEGPSTQISRYFGACYHEVWVLGTLGE